MMMTILSDNEVIRNFSITEEKKEIIEKFLELPVDKGFCATTIKEVLQDHEVIIDFSEFVEVETF